MLTASTNRHLLQPTKDNRARRKSRIQKIQENADAGRKAGDKPEHRDSASSGDSAATEEEGTSRGRSHASRIPIIGGIVDAVTQHTEKHQQDRSESQKSNRSQLVDLIIEDYDAEQIERVRARKEGSPGWNRHEPKHFVYAIILPLFPPLASFSFDRYFRE